MRYYRSAKRRRQSMPTSSCGGRNRLNAALVQHTQARATLRASRYFLAVSQHIVLDGTREALIRDFRAVIRQCRRHSSCREPLRYAFVNLSISRSRLLSCKGMARGNQQRKCNVLAVENDPPTRPPPRHFALRPLCGCLHGFAEIADRHGWRLPLVDTDRRTGKPAQQCLIQRHIQRSAMWFRVHHLKDLIKKHPPPLAHPKRHVRTDSLSSALLRPETRTRHTRLW